MTQTPFRYPIQVRYSDLDPQGHVNNANYLSYLEQARGAFLVAAGLWDGRNFFEVGIILASAQVDYRAAVLLGDPIQVTCWITKIGNRSFEMGYTIEDPDGKIYARASTTQVAYDYKTNQTMRVPDNWRAILQRYQPTSEEESTP